MLVESGVLLFHFRSATKYFFLNVVLNLAFGVLLGDPFPSIQETMGALVILLSLSVVSEKKRVGLLCEKGQPLFSKCLYPSINLFGRGC